ncbi:transporter substrate-binding domain-containing protein [Kingella negevensis]|uniref:Glutamine-binding periplasmic protein n=1 Tax=Kingella negevensis TaxID=1522312 RepID=A0A238TAY4_9NEIS|nr:transporter substrate-binding domain-containing protein [Kingella negevensis]SNB67536.1 Glutamine-binding periplasmic protein precursor [Kingella negevensis]
MKKLAILACSILALSACQNESQQQKAEPKDPPTAAPATANSSEKVYTVMSESDTLPFIMRDPKSPSGATGFEHDLLEAIAQKQGFKLKYDVHTWVGLFDTLNTGEADIVAGAVTMTDERAQTMDFSQPHYDYHYVMLVKNELGSANGFSALKGKKISLQQGSVSESLVPMFGLADKSNIIKQSTIWLAAKDVLRGSADAVIGSDAPLSYYAKEYPDSKAVIVHDESLPVQHYAFAVKKGNAELLAKLNEGLAAVKADGTYETLRKKYWK